MKEEHEGRTKEENTICCCPRKKTRGSTVVRRGKQGNGRGGSRREPHRSLFGLVTPVVGQCPGGGGGSRREASQRAWGHGDRSR